jgi:carbamate kinase
LTDVDGAYVDFGKPTQRKLGVVKVSELKKYYEEGHFGEGSMGPKVLAAIRFIENGGKRAVIAERSMVLAALEGKEGTQVYPD